VALEFNAPPIRPFLEWPVAVDPSSWDADVALIGLPHSEPYVGEPRPNDQALAPGQIRLASPQVSDGRDHWDFDIGATRDEVSPSRLIDCGDVPWQADTYDAHSERTTGLLRHLWRRGTQVFVLGGDHGITIPVLDALDAIGRPVHILHIDAHLDWREEVGGVRRGYSSPLFWASRMPWVSGMTQVGMRGTGSARRREIDAARDYGSVITTAEDIQRDGIGPVIQTIPEDAVVYVTIDADGIDPSDMPAVLAPVPGGLRFDQVARLLRISPKEIALLA
jgi:agmatinase